jgi:hypothetical protein
MWIARADAPRSAPGSASPGSSPLLERFHRILFGGPQKPRATDQNTTISCSASQDSYSALSPVVKVLGSISGGPWLTTNALGMATIARSCFDTTPELAVVYGVALTTGRVHVHIRNRGPRPTLSSLSVLTLLHLCRWCCRTSSTCSVGICKPRVPTSSPSSPFRAPLGSGSQALSTLLA